MRALKEATDRGSQREESHATGQGGNCPDRRPLLPVTMVLGLDNCEGKNAHSQTPGVSYKAGNELITGKLLVATSMPGASGLGWGGSIIGKLGTGRLVESEEGTAVAWKLLFLGGGGGDENRAALPGLPSWASSFVTGRW